MVCGLWFVVFTTSKFKGFTLIVNFKLQTINYELQTTNYKLFMERVAFKMQLNKGFEEEYKKRHDEIWPELQAVIKEQRHY